MSATVPQPLSSVVPVAVDPLRQQALSMAMQMGDGDIISRAREFLAFLRGESDIAVVEVVGPSGPMGPKGDKGDPGPVGPAGPSSPPAPTLTEPAPEPTPSV